MLKEEDKRSSVAKMFALLKVPFILLVSVAFHVAFTPPHVLQPDERPTKSFREKVLDAGVSIIALRKAVFWIAGFAEIIGLVNAEPRGFALKNTTAGTLNVNANFYLTPLSFVGMTLIVTGGLIRWVCYRTMKSLFTFEIAIRKNHKLITTGPYSVVRHPSYTGTLLVHLGMWLWYGSRGSWVRESGILDVVVGKMFVLAFVSMMTTLLVGLLRRAPVEDAMMRKEFGEQWNTWARRVPFALIPGVY